MAKIANTEGIAIDENDGLVGAGNEVGIKGGIGKNVAVGNTTDIKVKHNTQTGDIGAQNVYDMKGLAADASIGNTAKVSVSGNNSGAIGSGNKVNIN